MIQYKGAYSETTLVNSAMTCAIFQAIGKLRFETVQRTGKVTSVFQTAQCFAIQQRTEYILEFWMNSRKQYIFTHVII